MTSFIYIPIGVIRTPFKDGKAIPIQSAFSDAEGQIELYHPFEKGLKDLNGFSHIILLYHFHLTTKWQPLVKPFLDREERGIFAVRAPTRPNPIGFSIVRLKKISGTTLWIHGVDMIDETPLLDIKPYVPSFDSFNDAKEGWIWKSLGKNKIPLSNGRFNLPE